MKKTVKSYLIWLLSALCSLFLVFGVATFNLGGAAASAETVPVTGTAEAVTGKVELESFTMISGAGVKKEGTYQGIRFTTQISTDDLAKLPSNASFGTLILPKHMFDGQLTKNTESALDVKAYVWKNTSTSTMKEFTGVLANIPESFYKTDMVARSYVTYTDENGVEYTVYAKNSQTRDLVYVASAALNAGEEGDLLTTVVNSASPTLAFSSSTVSVKIGVPYTLTLASGKGEGLEVSYESANESIALVDDNGVVLGVGIGATTVTATSNGMSATVQVSVVEEIVEEELPTWTDLSVNSNIGYKSGAWTVTPTEADMVAIGGVSGASYRGVQANEGYFGYTHVKLLPTNTDSTYWEAYADYTLKFDWYYNFATDRNFTATQDVTSKVEVFGATSAVYAHSTWHTSSIKISELLNVWSEVTSTSLAGNEKVSNWLNFRWTSGVSDNYPGTVYFGNVRIEAPEAEVPVWNDLSSTDAIKTTANRWTQTVPAIPTASEITAIGGVSNAAYLRVDGSAGFFNYAGYKILPANDKAYYEALAGSTVKFDWYYDVPSSETAQYNVVPYGGASAKYAQDTWHTVSIPMDSLLAEWDNLIDNSDPMTLGTAWIDFNWTSGVSDLAGVLYIGNIRIEQEQQTVVPEEVDANVWTAGSTEKFLQNQSYSERYTDTTLTFNAFKNETESAQIIITPNQDVAWYGVMLSSLVNADGEVLSLRNFNLFHQKYMEVTEVKTGEATTVLNGMYPDALVPLSAAAAYGENTVASGNNQGVWVTVSVPADQAVGLYTGTFTVLLNGDVFEVPVSVNVYDYAVSDEMQSETRFGLGWDNVEYAEGLDGGSATEEVQRAYYEYMLDLGVSLSSLPGVSDFYFHYNGTYDPESDVFADDFAFTYGGADYDGDGVNEYYANTTNGKMETYVQEVARYTLDERCSMIPLAVRTYEGVAYEQDENGEWVPVTKYTLTYDYNGTSYAIKSVDQAQLKRTVEELYKYSLANGVNLFEKLYLVLPWIDEFSNNLEELASADYNLGLLSDWFINCRGYLETQADYTLGEGVTESFRTQVLDTIMGLKVLTPTASTASLTAEDMPFIYCPTIDMYHLESNREMIKAWVEEAYGEGTPLWAYTCVNPSQPNPTYHLGDNLISSRLLSWMMYEYGITGNLYWSTMYIQNGAVDSTEYITDMYDNPLRSGEVNGDGFLLYPGAAYGITGPVGSIRLQSIGDGLEEYNLLSALESYAKARAAAKGETYQKSNFNSVLHMLTELLYSGTQVKYESEYLNNFANSREMLAELLVLAKNGIVLENSVTSGDTVVVTISAPEGVEFTVNGAVEEATANGYVTYTVTLSVAEDGSLNIQTGSGDTEEETETLPIPTWSDISVNDNIGYKSGAWTVTPTEADMVAIGGVSGASYRGVQANEGYFGYTHVKLLPTNTDSTYWEAYADYTLKFDWYYNFATDRNFTATQDVTSKVEVFGATSAVYAHSTWHTSSIKISELLNVWSEVTSTSLAGNEKVSNWLNFRWTSGVSDNYPGTVYFGNIRIEAPAKEVSTVNVATTYFAETATTPIIDLTSIYTENGGTESVTGATATLTSVYGEVVTTSTPASLDITTVPQGAYSVVLKKGDAVLMNATVDIYTAADGLVWVDMARLAALEDISDIAIARTTSNSGVPRVALTVEEYNGSYHFVMTANSSTTWMITKGLMLKSLHSKEYVQQMYNSGYTHIKLNVSSTNNEGYFSGNGETSTTWFGTAVKGVQISVANLLTNWDVIHDFENISTSDDLYTNCFFVYKMKNVAYVGDFSYTGSGSAELTPAVSAGGVNITEGKEMPNISLAMPLTAGASYSETAWGSVNSSKTNATYLVKSSSLQLSTATSSMSVVTLSSSSKVGGRTSGDYYNFASSSTYASNYHCFTLKASDKTAMEALLAECGDIELSFDVYFTVVGTHSTTVRNCFVTGQVGNKSLQEGVWHTLSVKLSTLLENWDSLASTSGGFSTAKCLFAINGTYGSETNQVNCYIGNFKLVEP